MNLRPGRAIGLAVLIGGSIACAREQAPTGTRPDERDSDFAAAACDLDSEFLIVGAPLDAIQSLDSSSFVSAEETVPDYLEPDTRIIGLVVGTEAFAVPHNVLWFHEIVNLHADDRDLAVTYCPLTGSSLAFDRRTVGGEPFGVSGLLFMSNLVMFDRDAPRSRWPQMMGEARCGPQSSNTLPRWPVVEMEWSEWHTLHPSTRVLAGDQGFDDFSYEATAYPYGAYEDHSISSFFGPMPPADRRRPAKERVLGIPETFNEGGMERRDPGIAFPFGALIALPGRIQVVEFLYDGRSGVLLWSDEARGGMAFRPRTPSGTTVSLGSSESGIEDERTGSRWSVEGRATSGPMEGAQLMPLERAHTAFWGAWTAFHPETRLWE